MGYPIALTFQGISIYYAGIFVGALLSISFGSCALLQCFVKDITNDLRDLNVTTKSAKSKNKTSAKEESAVSKMNVKKIEKIFAKTIEYHLELKQLSCVCAPCTKVWKLIVHHC